jgi:hypothetical protein
MAFLVGVARKQNSQDKGFRFAKRTQNRSNQKAIPHPVSRKKRKLPETFDLALSLWGSYCHSY